MTGPTENVRFTSGFDPQETFREMRTPVSLGKNAPCTHRLSDSETLLCVEKRRPVSSFNPGAQSARVVLPVLRRFACPTRAGRLVIGCIERPRMPLGQRYELRGKPCDPVGMALLYFAMIRTAYLVSAGVG